MPQKDEPLSTTCISPSWAHRPWNFSFDLNDKVTKGTYRRWTTTMTKASLVLAISILAHKNRIYIFIYSFVDRPIYNKLNGRVNVRNFCEILFSLVPKLLPPSICQIKRNVSTKKYPFFVNGKRKQISILKKQQSLIRYTLHSHRINN